MATAGNSPKISVVTVSFNQGEFIRQNIESVLAQEYPNFEHIIIDGGSNDGTLDILREYSHLNWTSEPDRGQSDGLNKGFAKATGDIIAWLNSDDWYAPDCFKIIARELQTYPLLLGAAQQTDREGNPTELVPNCARTKFDLLRNWIPYAWLAQTSVFFTRELLEEVAHGPLEYLDESLEFCMDLDLWMRLADKFPFARRVDSVLSYFRIYESNKTGSRAVAGNKECMRVFRRYENAWNRVERSVAMILPLTSISDLTAGTIQSLVDQSVGDFEVILVDCSGRGDMSKRIREYTLDLAEAINHINFRFVRSESKTLTSGYNAGARAAAANYLCFLQDGDTVDSDFCLRTIQFFCRDLAGLCLPTQLPDIDCEALMHSETRSLDPLALLRAPLNLPRLAVRKLAFLENDGFRYEDVPPLSFKLLLLELITRGWWVTAGQNIQIRATAKQKNASDLQGLSTLIAARAVTALDQLFRENEFQRFKASQKLCLQFPASVQETAHAILDGAPTDWHALPDTTSVTRLQQFVKMYPDCASVWYYFALALDGDGRRQEAAEARVRYQHLADRFLGE